jgi:hypothetical protein
MIVGLICSACKNWAAFSDDTPVFGAPMNSDKWITPDGRILTDVLTKDRAFLCPKCRIPIGPGKGRIHRLL